MVLFTKFGLACGFFFFG